MANESPRSVDVLPPADPAFLLRLSLIGMGCCALAALLGLGEILNTLRLLLVAGGVLTAAVALERSPGNARSWWFLATAFFLAWPGLPAHWDSARMVARVLACGSLAGGLLVSLSLRTRLGILSAFALFHFGNMVMATTSPDPTPWVTTQVMTRVYMPYMRFMYLGNAYHFYSPEPGPSSHLYCLLIRDLGETVVEGDKKVFKPNGNTEAIWIDLPRRDENYIDPLGLSYYRRLSITELVSQSIPSQLTLATFEKNRAWLDRRNASLVSAVNPIPLSAEADPIEAQYRIPRADISRYLFPSYARHIASNPKYNDDRHRVARLKLYRVEHRVIGMREFLTRNENGKGASPYHPMSYRPYYLGEYDANGVLLNPQDPMLYWLTPILPDPNAPLDPNRPAYIDYMSKHAGYQFLWRERP